jgi:hypothetical protein
VKSLKFLGLVALAAIFFGLPASGCASTGNAVVGHSAVAWVTSVDGTAPFTFQWYKNGTVIAGATGTALPPTISQATIVGNSAYVITTVAATDAGVYTCVVTNAAGSTTSDGATLVVVVTPGNAVTATWSN